MKRIATPAQEVSLLDSVSLAKSLGKLVARTLILAAGDPETALMMLDNTEARNEVDEIALSLAQQSIREGMEG